MPKDWIEDPAFDIEGMNTCQLIRRQFSTAPECALRHFPSSSAAQQLSGSAAQGLRGSGAQGPKNSQIRPYWPPKTRQSESFDAISLREVSRQPDCDLQSETTTE